MRAKLGAAFVIVSIVALGCAAWIWRDEIAELAARTRESGVKGYVVLLTIYVAIALVALPVSWFTAIAGYLCGPWIAIALACVGTTGGASLAFLLGRRVFAPRVAAWIAKKPRIDALSRGIGGEGFKFVTLARLSPLSPFGVLTYALSVMPVKFGAFFAGTALGKLPGNVFYALVGAGAQTLHAASSGEARIEVWEWILFGVGIAATGILLWLLTRMAKAAFVPRTD